MKTKYIILITILLTALVVVGFFISLNYLGNFIQNQNELSFNEGAEAAVLTILKNVAQCPEEGVDINYQNQTFTLYLKECFNDN